MLDAVPKQTAELQAKIPHVRTELMQKQRRDVFQPLASLRDLTQDVFVLQL